MSEEEFSTPRYAPALPRPSQFDSQPEELTPGVNWRTLDSDEARTVWLELDSWVSWLVHRFALPGEELADCWWKHGGAVEELSALQACWLASFDETDTGYGPIGWHERFDLSRVRLRKTFSSCRTSHNPTKARVLIRDADEWQAWITESHAHQSTSTSPR